MSRADTVISIAVVVAQTLVVVADAPENVRAVVLCVGLPWFMWRYLPGFKELHFGIRLAGSVLVGLLATFVQVTS